MSTSESTIKHSGCKSLLKSHRPEMKLEKMSIDLSWLGNSRILKFVPFEWQLKAAKCYPWLRDLTPLPNTGCTATEDVNGLRTIAALGIEAVKRQIQVPSVLNGLSYFLGTAREHPKPQAGCWKGFGINCAVNLLDCCGHESADRHLRDAGKGPDRRHCGHTLTAVRSSNLLTIITGIRASETKGPNAKLAEMVKSGRPYYPIGISDAAVHKTALFQQTSPRDRGTRNVLVWAKTSMPIGLVVVGLYTAQDSYLAVAKELYYVIVTDCHNGRRSYGKLLAVSIYIITSKKDAFKPCCMAMGSNENPNSATAQLNQNGSSKIDSALNSKELLVDLREDTQPMLI
ncbi:hypothetical protein C8J56DRAFT_1031945 [Mycena floridula]|nr:hypothetical protein C8J56DRAFT_1031945 [Mycena floridula]